MEVPLAPSPSVAAAFSMLGASIMADAVCCAQTIDTGPDAGAEALHGLRVALRRLRALWWAYRPLLDTKLYKDQCDAFKQIADAAGATREWDVLQELLKTDGLGRKWHSNLANAVGQQRTPAFEASHERTDSSRVDQTLNCALGSCQAQLAALASPPALPVFARSRIDLVVRAVRKQAARALQRGHHTNASLHAVRIEMKKLRYLLELFSLLLPDVAGSDPKWLSMIQDRLGALNDVVVSKALVRQHANEPGSRKTLRKAIRRLQKREKRLMSEVKKALRGRAHRLRISGL